MQTKEVSLYKGKLNIAFHWSDVNPKIHHYTLNDKKLISVTGALGMIGKPQLLYWAVNLACDHLKEALDNGQPITYAMIEAAREMHGVKSAEAAEIGTRVHAWAQSFINGENPQLPDPDTDPLVMNGISAFMDWVDKHKVKFKSTERIVYSKKYGYVGTMDAEAIIDGKLSVLEFKTSKRPKCPHCKKDEQVSCRHNVVYPEWRYQSAAYQRAAQEEGSKYNGHRYIIRFDKEDGHFEATRVQDIMQDYYAFLGALTLKKRQDELTKKPKLYVPKAA